MKGIAVSKIWSTFSNSKNTLFELKRLEGYYSLSQVKYNPDVLPWQQEEIGEVIMAIEDVRRLREVFDKVLTDYDKEW